MASNNDRGQVINSMSRAEQDAQTIRQFKEQIERLRKELDEFIKAEQVLIAAGLVSEEKVKQAHEIGQKIG